jgi:hypothetical protein
MAKFYIESKAGVIMGLYEGSSKEEAVEALNAEAGSESTTADWIIFEVVDVDQDWDHEATLYTLSNDGVYVESGPSGNYYRDIEAAREALAD